MFLGVLSKAVAIFDYFSTNYLKMNQKQHVILLKLDNIRSIRQAWP